MSRIDDFKAVLSQGGARANLFRVRGSFPGTASTVLGTALGAVGGAAGGALGNALAGSANALGGGGPARQVEFLVKAAQLPGSQLGVI